MLLSTEKIRNSGPFFSSLFFTRFSACSSPEFIIIDILIYDIKSYSILNVNSITRKSTMGLDHFGKNFKVGADRWGRALSFFFYVDLCFETSSESFSGI